MLDARPAERDATVVRRLREAGAVIVGKLHQTEFALSGYHPSLPVPVNPWDPSRFPGLSSSGSGVATAAGLAFATLGTDTGGSIRFPSAACGVVGLKPTRGRVSRHGVFPLGGSLDHVGPLTRCTADAAAVLDAIAGADPDDPSALHAPSPSCVASLARGARGVRVGVDEAYATDGVEPAVAEAFRAHVKQLASTGATIVPVRVPPIEAPLSAWAVICAAEAVFHHRGLFPERAASYGPTFRSFLEWGDRLSAADVAAAWIARDEWTTQLAALLASVDMLACPSMPVLPLPVAALAPQAPLRSRSDGADPLHRAVQLLGQPDALDCPAASPRTACRSRCSWSGDIWTKRHCAVSARRSSRCPRRRGADRPTPEAQVLDSLRMNAIRSRMPWSLTTPPQGAISGDFPTEAPPCEITLYRCASVSEPM